MSDFGFSGPGRRNRRRWTSSRRRGRPNGFAAATTSPRARIPAPRCVFHFINPDKPKPFRRRQRSTYVVAVHTLRQPARRRAAKRVPDAGARAREHRDAGRARRRVLLRDARAGQLLGARSRQSRRVGQGAVRPARAARDVAAGDRQPLRHRPRARAVGRRRVDRAAARGRASARQPRPAARHRSRWIRSSAPTTCAGSSWRTASAGSRTATCRCERTPIASG